MKRLLIIGAGGFGREIYGWAKDVQEKDPGWELGGFLDENIYALDDYSYPIGIVGNPDTYLPSDNDLFICAIGDPVAKLDICQLLEDRGANFITLIHPTAIIGPKCELGYGCILCPGSLLTTNVSLGNFVTLNVYATVGHEAVIGDGSTLSGHADVTGSAKLGKGVFLGSHAVVLPSATVEDFVTVGAGSTVLRFAQSNSTVFGVPAKNIYSS